METLKDIKEVLIKIPDEVLSNLWFGLGENQEEEINLIAGETGDETGFPEVFDKYSDVTKIGDLIRNIIKVQRLLDKGDKKAEELSELLFQPCPVITDTFKFEVKQMEEKS